MFLTLINTLFTVPKCSTMLNSMLNTLFAVPKCHTAHFIQVSNYAQYTLPKCPTMLNTLITVAKCLTLFNYAQYTCLCSIHYSLYPSV